MKKLAVIGLGARIRWLVGQLDAFDADLKLVAVVDPNEAGVRKLMEPEKLADVVFYPDVDTMLLQAEPDAVMIGTTCNLHTDYAKKVLAYNLPLYLEKPVSISMEETEDLYRASLSSSSEVVVSFPLRLSRLAAMAKEVIDSGVLGSVENVQAVNNVPFYGSNYFHGWMRNDKLTGGLWLQKATHDLDYLTYLIGRLPERIVAVESKNVFTGDMPAGLYCLDCPKQDTCPESQKNLFYMQGIIEDMHQAKDFWDGRWQCSFAVDTGNHDSATAILQYADGSHMTYTQNFYARRSAAKRGGRFIGYKGTMEFDFYSDEVVVHYHQSARTDRLHLDALGGGHHGGDTELLHDFLAIVHKTGKSRATLIDGITSARLCLTARESCETNGFVPFQPLESLVTTPSF
ncbi:MAG: Gfo/Idh/MocA family oxidoreductase [Thermomicrobiales bacterium]|nr:Gfo/Idh/MocA family oxidoreductase [Thermomicrobiales bacterium]